MTAARSADESRIASAKSLVGNGKNATAMSSAQIDGHDPAVCVPQASEDAVMDQPDPSDRDEARRIAQVRRPLISDAAPKMIELGLGNADVENEKRDRDREHTVAERLGSAVCPAVPHRAPLRRPAPLSCARVDGRRRARQPEATPPPALTIAGGGTAIARQIDFELDFDSLVSTKLLTESHCRCRQRADRTGLDASLASQ